MTDIDKYIIDGIVSKMQAEYSLRAKWSITVTENLDGSYTGLAIMIYDGHSPTTYFYRDKFARTLDTEESVLKAIHSDIDKFRLSMLHIIKKAELIERTKTRYEY